MRRRSRTLTNKPSNSMMLLIRSIFLFVIMMILHEEDTKHILTPASQQGGKGTWVQLFVMVEAYNYWPQHSSKNSGEEQSSEEQKQQRVESSTATTNNNNKEGGIRGGTNTNTNTNTKKDLNIWNLDRNHFFPPSTTSSASTSTSASANVSPVPSKDSEIVNIDGNGNVNSSPSQQKQHLSNITNDGPPPSASTIPLLIPDTTTKTSTIIPPKDKDRTCLIVQDAAPGPETVILDATSKVNRAYAKRWGHDYLKFTGIALIEDDSNNNGNSGEGDNDDAGEAWQATFNKPYILNTLLKAKKLQEQQQQQGGVSNQDAAATTNDPNGLPITDGDSNNNKENNNNSTAKSTTQPFPPYDIVLFLDSSAMIVQLDYDVLDLIPNEKMMANGMVMGSNGEFKSEYTDVMVWNMNHPQVPQISDWWIEQSKNNVNNKVVTGQTLLMEILENNIDTNEAQAILQSIPVPMVNGLQGTIIKQDVSSYTKINGNGSLNQNVHTVEEADLYKIMPVVQGIAESVCYRFYPQCEVI